MRPVLVYPGVDRPRVVAGHLVGLEIEDVGGNSLLPIAQHHQAVERAAEDAALVANGKRPLAEKLPSRRMDAGRYMHPAACFTRGLLIGGFPQGRGNRRLPQRRAKPDQQLRQVEVLEFRRAGNLPQGRVVRLAVLQPADLLEPEVQQGAAIERLAAFQPQLRGQMHQPAAFQP